MAGEHRLDSTIGHECIEIDGIPSAGVDAD